MTFKEKVLELRMRLQITQVQLAELLGVSYPTVNRWEGGHYEVFAVPLCRLHRNL